MKGGEKEPSAGEGRKKNQQKGGKKELSWGRCSENIAETPPSRRCRRIREKGKNREKKRTRHGQEERAKGTQTLYLRGGQNRSQKRKKKTEKGVRQRWEKATGERKKAHRAGKKAAKFPLRSRGKGGTFGGGGKN